MPNSSLLLGRLAPRSRPWVRLSIREGLHVNKYRSNNDLLVIERRPIRDVNNSNFNCIKRDYGAIVLLACSNYK